MPRAVALARAQVIASDIHPLNNLRVLKYLTKRSGAQRTDQGPLDRDVDRAGVRGARGDGGRGRYLGGDTPGIADCCLVPQIYNARRFEVPLDAYPRLVEIDAACMELDAVPSVHPDAVKPA